MNSQLTFDNYTAPVMPPSIIELPKYKPTTNTYRRNKKITPLPNEYNRKKIENGESINKEVEELEYNRSVKIPTQPIKDENTLQQIQLHLLTKDERYSMLKLRDYAFFTVGMNLAMRVSDLISLKVRDIVNIDTGEIKDIIYRKAKKTNKGNNHVITDMTKDALNEFFKSQPWLLDDFDNYLFYSRNNKVMSRQRAHQIMKEIATDLELKENLGTHSLRKTMAYQILKANKGCQQTITYLMAILGHTSVTSLFHYVGIDTEEKQKLLGRGLGWTTSELMAMSR